MCRNCAMMMKAVIKRERRICCVFFMLIAISMIWYFSEILRFSSIMKGDMRSSKGRDNRSLALPSQQLVQQKNILIRSAKGYPYVYKKMISDMKSTKHTWPYGHQIPLSCARYMKLENLPDASVIITFYDGETLSNILHTVHSVFQRTPPRLLREVILVNDCAIRDNLRSILSNYIKAVFPKKVKLIVSNTRLGLIQARRRGVLAARGHVVVLMDSHMEVQKHWLEPLLGEIAADNKTLAQSYLDWMKYKNGTWEYIHGSSTWKTFFEWDLAFGFIDSSPADQKKSQNNKDAPIRTPTYVGTGYAISRVYLIQLGIFDEALVLWGGENIELSLKVWQCGGRVVNVPCSHTAHLEKKGMRNYRDSFDHVIDRNYKRVADAWLGEYRKYFYQYKPYLSAVPFADTNTRAESIKRSCSRNMTWLLREVFPELGLPDKNSFAFGELRNMKTNTCLDRTDDQEPRMLLCHENHAKYQDWFWNTKGEIRNTVYTLNTDDTSLGSRVTLGEYVREYGTDRPQKWLHWKAGLLIENTSGYCLESIKDELFLEKCDKTNLAQRWAFAKYSTYYQESVTAAKTKQIKRKMHENEKDSTYHIRLRKTFIHNINTVFTRKKHSN